MTDIAKLVVSYETNTAKLVAGTNSAVSAVNRASRQMEASMGGVSRAVDAVSSHLRAAFGAAIGGSIIAMGANAVETAGNFGELAQQVGLTTDELQALRFAAVQNNLSTEQFEGALIKLNDTLDNAARGNDEAIRAFDRLGVKILDARGQMRSTADVLTDVARGLGAISDPARQAGAANDLFGRTGARLIPLLLGMTDGVRGYIDAARDANAIIDPDTIARADALGDAWARIKIQIAAVAAYPAIAVFEALSNILTMAIRGGPILMRILDHMTGNAPSQQPGAEDRDRLAQMEIEYADVNSQLERLTVGQELWNGSVRETQIRVEYLRSRLHDLREDMDAIRGRGVTPSEDLPPLGDQPPRLRIELNTPRGGSRNPRGTQATAQANQELERRAQAYEQLLRSISPVYRAEAEYADALDMLNERYPTLIGHEEEYNAILLQLELRYNRAINAADHFGDTANQTAEIVASLQGAASDLGYTFESAFENAVLKLQSVRNIMGSILQDIARTILRRGITEPIGNAVSGMFGQIAAGDVPGWVGSLGLESIWPFASGGIMSSRGALPLHSYAGGGVATSPQMAIFGEGRMKEAFVPLPDGANIPVKLYGGGGRSFVVAPVYHIDARGAGPGESARLAAMADRITAQTVAVVRGLSRDGGPFARDTGARKR